MIKYELCENSQLKVSASLLGRITMVDKEFQRTKKLSKDVSAYFNEGVQARGLGNEPNCSALNSWCGEVATVLFRAGPIEQKSFFEKHAAYWISQIIENSENT